MSAGSVTAQLQLFHQLEGQLLKLRKEKSFTDPAVRDVRRQLRATSELILLQNYTAASVRLPDSSRPFIVERACPESTSPITKGHATEEAGSCGRKKQQCSRYGFRDSRIRVWSPSSGINASTDQSRTFEGAFKKQKRKAPVLLRWSAR